MTAVDTSERAPGAIARRLWPPELGAALVAAAGALCIAAWILRDSLGHLNETWDGGDSPAIYMHVKALLDHPWITPNPDLGWPYGLDSVAFPLTHTPPLLVLKALVFVTQDPVVTVNIFFLLSYPAAALTGYLLLRWAGVHRLLSIILAIGFATVPWHAMRFHHLFYADYSMVPVAIFLVSLPACRADRLAMLGRRRAVLWTVISLASLGVGLSGAYLGAFCLVLLGVVLVSRWVVSGVDRPHAWATLVAFTGILVGLVASWGVTRLLDTSPTAAPISVRAASDAYLYGGDLLSMVLPSNLTFLAGLLPDRVIHQMAAIGEVTLVEGNGYASPFVAVACVIAFTLAIGVALGGRRRRWLRQMAPWSGILMVATAAFAIGGIGALVAQFALPQVRSWGRLSIWVILLALVILGLLITSLSRRAAGRRTPLLVASAVLAILVLDQATQATAPVPNTGQRAGLTSVGTFADALLGPGCPIFTYPSKEYPESGQVNDMIDYAHFYPYLFLHGHPISYGSVKGTVEDLWQRQLPPDPAALAPEAAAMGFCGVLVDTYFWAASDRAEQRRNWDQSLGTPIASAMDRWYLYGLRGADAADAAPARARWDVVAVPTDADYAVDYATGAISWWHGSTHLSVALVNATEEQRSGVVTMIVKAAPCLAEPVQLGAPGSQEGTLGLGAGEQATFTFPVGLGPHGSRAVPISIVGTPCQVAGDPRQLLVQVLVGSFVPSATATQGAK